MRFETMTVHAGGERDETGAIAPPLHLSSNYEHGPSGEILHGYLYARKDNPIQRRLEKALLRSKAVRSPWSSLPGLLREQPTCSLFRPEAMCSSATIFSMDSGKWPRAFFPAGESNGRMRI